MAMGYETILAQSGLRITLGRETTEADIDWTVIVLRQVTARITTGATVLV